MDRIGVITKSCRIEELRLSPLAPVPFWRRVRFLLVIFGLISFFSGFAAGQAQAAPAGSVEYLIECKIIGTNGNSTAPCVTVGANRYAPVMVQAYVIDPLSASYIDQLSTPFDYALGSAFWAFGFSGVMILYFSSHVIGLVLKKVRNG